MTVTLQQGFLESALRHARDARALLETSHHQAFHLAGFAPECARKAVPGLAAFGKALGHDVAPDDRLQELFTALDAQGHRYDWTVLLDWGTVYPALAKWNPQIRYEANSAVLRASADQLVGEAEAAAARVLATLWADGAFPKGALK
jgi:hypothetical protein